VIDRDQRHHLAQLRLIRIMPIMACMNETLQKFETRVAIVGVGLIGGSIAAAIRKRHPDCDVVGIGRSIKRLQAAQAAGILTHWAETLTEEMLQERQVVVICLPVNLIADFARSIAAKAGPNLLITDAGSVKASICKAMLLDEIAAGMFVGAHPIAGGELGGFENADPDLFDNRVCVIADSLDQSDAAKRLVRRATRFWSGIGCRIITMTAEDHDRALALTSHLPHLMAAVTASVVGPENLALTGTGFRDATRIAAGDAALWKEILIGNRDRVLEAIDSAQALLADYRAAMEDNDGNRVEELLHAASSCRAKLHN